MDRPRFITAALTNRCNSRCVKCAVWRMKERPEELPAETWVRIVSRLHDWLGDFELVLSGGEPTLKEGYLDVIRHAAGLGVTAVLNSNGLALDPAEARLVAETGVDNVCLSVDGPRAINDAIKGVPGATWRLWDAVETLKCVRPSIKVTIMVVLLRANMAVIPDFVSGLLRDERIHRIRFQAVVPPLGEGGFEDWFGNAELWPDDPTAVNRSLDWLIEQKRGGARIDNAASQLEVMRKYFAEPSSISGIRCGVGRNAFFIATDGSAYLCNAMASIGNVCGDDVVAFWNGETAAEVRREIESCTRFCHQLVNCCYTED